jgi:hypothetical protein
LFDVNNGAYGIPSHLLGDKCYYLINWIMTYFKEERQHVILEFLYNRKHKGGHSMIENNGILKKLSKC